MGQLILNLNLKDQRRSLATQKDKDNKKAKKKKEFALECKGKKQNIVKQQRILKKKNILKNKMK